MAKTKRRTLWAENAMFEGGLEIRDVRVTFPAHMTVEGALQAGILLATEWPITIYATWALTGRA
jgi:hypothetical protein